MWRVAGLAVDRILQGRQIAALGCLDERVRELFKILLLAHREKLTDKMLRPTRSLDNFLKRPAPARVRFLFRQLNFRMT